ncbi:hypothetical protein BLOT_001137 [Blomia tropicalis]|nr:hypothetical protein BLOT_001137 [Blomia tropicalis]
MNNQRINTYAAVGFGLLLLFGHYFETIHSLPMKSNGMNKNGIDLKEKKFGPPTYNFIPKGFWKQLEEKIRRFKRECLSGIGGSGCVHKNIQTEAPLIEHNSDHNYKNP